MPRPLFVLSGIGADERLFERQRAVRDIRPIRHIPPLDGHETLARYAARLAVEIPTDEPFDLGGASFGGMLALEMARHLSPERVFLFGSGRSADAVAPLLRAIHPLAAIALDCGLVHPPRIFIPPLARWFGATAPWHVQLFREMLAATPPEFIRWAAGAILSWPGVRDLPMPIHHIHGARDRVIPLPRVAPERIVAGAGHLLTITHAAEVNDFIVAAL